MNILREQPARLVGAIGLTLNLLVMLGVIELTTDQLAALNTAIGAWVGVIVGQQVTPNVNVPGPVGTAAKRNILGLTTTKSNTLLLVPFAVAAALAGSACSARTVHRLAIVDGQLAKAVSRIQDAEIAAFRRLPCATPETTDCISEERHQAYQQVFLQLADLGTAATQALRAGDGETATGQIQAALDLVETLLDGGQGALVGLDAEEARVFRLGIETVRSIFLAMAAS